MAEVTVRFDAEIVAVSRDAEGRVISGDQNSSVETHDIWTFSRHTTSSDPSWLLVATDEVAG
jgi:predicted lipid-binding transport protein (Tim44 family)